MKYEVIIQELKASNDKNVRAFVRDMEKLKRMTKKQRDIYLKNRQKPGAVTKLMEGFIPYSILVAYNHSEKVNTLSVLDLINEGILGEPLTRRRVRSQIKTRIRKASNYRSNCHEDEVFDEFAPDKCTKEVLLFGI